MHIKTSILMLGLACFAVPCAKAQPTAFTYQGRLNVGGSPANGIYDLRFTIYDGLGGGNVVGGPVTNGTVLVTNGLFSTTMDFGSTAFPGANRWLEIAVRTNGSIAPYFSLGPRQAITASPYAIRASTIADGAITATKLGPGVGANG